MFAKLWELKFYWLE